MIAEDRENIKEIEGQMLGYATALNHSKSIEKNILTQLNLTLQQLSTSEAELTMTEELLSNLNSNEDQQIETWQVTRDWTFSWHEISFSFSRPYPITIRKSAPNTYQWEVKESENRQVICIEGKLIGSWFRGVQAWITVYARKKDINEKQISELKNKKIDLDSTISALKKKQEALVPERFKASSEIQNLQTFLEKCTTNLNKASKMIISLEEAIDRLKMIVQK